MAKANGKMYSEDWAFKTLHPPFVSLQEACFSLYITPGNYQSNRQHVCQTKRMLALETDLTLISPRRKKTSQQMVFAQGFTPKSQVIPTQKGPVK